MRYPPTVVVFDVQLIHWNCAGCLNTWDTSHQESEGNVIWQYTMIALRLVASRSTVWTACITQDDYPQIANQKELSFDGRPLKYAPGLCGYLRYPQPETSILASQRWTVRCLWEKCYFAKDFQGAVQVTCLRMHSWRVCLVCLMRFSI